MNLATLIPLALKASIILVIFILGLNVRPQDAAYLFRRPGKLMRSLLSMNVVMPLFAAGVVAAFELHPAVELALIALAVSPIPPLLPRKSLKAGERRLTPSACLWPRRCWRLCSFPSPWICWEEPSVGACKYRRQRSRGWCLMTVIAPLAAGMVVRRVAPAF